MERALNLAAESVLADSLRKVGSPGFQFSDSEKVARIEYHFGKIMEALGLDLNDETLRDTPLRMANMYVKEIFSGLDPCNYPAISLFTNTFGYHEMLIEKDIKLFSYCHHHFLPIVGRAHCAYMPHEKVIGLSKINRLVQYFSNRPQDQEKLTMEIADGLKSVLQTEDVAVCIQAEHMCVSSIGIKDCSSAVVTHHFGGQFKTQSNRQAFFDYVL